MSFGDQSGGGEGALCDLGGLEDSSHGVSLRGVLKGLQGHSDIQGAIGAETWVTPRLAHVQLLREPRHCPI